MRLPCTLPFTLAALLLAPTALAAEPHTANSIQIGVGSRYGFELEQGDFNPWGLGFGLDVGYTLPSAMYIGGNFDYFLGKLPGDAEPETANLWQVTAEVGYDLAPEKNFVIRPKVGIGPATLNGSPSGTYLGLTPGATFIVLVSELSLVLDFRYELVLVDGEALEALLFSAGIGF